MFELIKLEWKKNKTSKYIRNAADSYPFGLYRWNGGRTGCGYLYGSLRAQQYQCVSRFIC